jgi:hypothetical protein
VRPVRDTSPHLAHTPVLKSSIAHGENLIDDQDLRLEMSGDGEGEAHAHSTACSVSPGYPMNASISEKSDDLHQLCRNLAARHAENRAIQKYVIAPRQLLVESRCPLRAAKRRGRAASPIASRGCDGTQDLEERGLPRRYGQSLDHFALPHIHGDIELKPKTLLGESSLLAGGAAFASNRRRSSGG